MENIKLFATKQLRSNYEDSTRYVEPYVSLEEETNEVSYNIEKNIIKITVAQGQTATITKYASNTDLSGTGNNIVLNEGENILNIDADYPYGFKCSSNQDKVVGVDLKQFKGTEIWNYAFQNCNAISSITIPDSVSIIGSRSFEGCSSLSVVNFNNNTTKIFAGAFSGCEKIKEIVLSKNIKTIDAGAFEHCTSLSLITNFDNLTLLGTSAFVGCVSLKKIVLPESLDKFGGNVFTGCSSLSSVTIPSSITLYKPNNFKRCTSLTSITFTSKTPNSNYLSEMINNPIRNIYVPQDAVQAYKTAQGWESYASMIKPIEQ
jgi:hypothetical protein